MTTRKLSAIKKLAQTPSTTAAQVFTTPELLEAILLDPVISPKNLLILQRTCKTFHQTVLGSPSLQRKVFRKQHPASTVTESSSRKILPNGMFVPIDSFPYLENSSHIHSSGARYTLFKDRTQFYRLSWIVHRRFQNGQPVLCIDVFKRRDEQARRWEDIPKVFREAFICDVAVDMIVFIQARNRAGKTRFTNLNVSGGSKASFDRILGVARAWAVQMRSQNGSMEDITSVEDGMSFGGNMRIG
ncbi:uncharacterized protein RCC_08868 [Ramularia collo-cygni]|uniref:F-box domain-containing protein n=1 Tax=Ramularia collo-cygni TaxID=112498 RepID=A0A2D3VN73_9PEZI|nr:uncharacterized protein RCC_08868 [Ramularia collo-cygni]CZT23158.1 uncharacterized protein RCC_08868 [Ramularia collo-cygni]